MRLTRETLIKFFKNVYEYTISFFVQNPDASAEKQSLDPAPDKRDLD